MNISVIIPTYNAEKYLPGLLEKLESQSIDFELLIIDSSSTDATRTLAERSADRVITIPKSEFDHGGTRTVAARAATGDILVYLTQDALPADRYTIERICALFEDERTGAAYGRQLPYPETSLFGKHLRSFNYPPISHRRSFADKEKYGMKTVFLSDSFAAYRREALEKAGWIKDGLISSEDSYAGAKILLAGYDLAYVAEAAVYHSHSYTPLEEFRRYFDIGVFYSRERWILDTFGRVEGEGGRYIRSELRYLKEHNAYIRLPEFLLRNGMKYLGFKLGQHYRYIPRTLIPRISMHPGWWSKAASRENK